MIVMKFLGFDISTNKERRNKMKELLKSTWIVLLVCAAFAAIFGIFVLIDMLTNYNKTIGLSVVCVVLFTLLVSIVHTARMR